MQQGYDYRVANRVGDFVVVSFQPKLILPTGQANRISIDTLSDRSTMPAVMQLPSILCSIKWRSLTSAATVQVYCVEVATVSGCYELCHDDATSAPDSCRSVLDNIRRGRLEAMQGHINLLSASATGIVRLPLFACLGHHFLSGWT
jgi:hypothetical protein